MHPIKRAASASMSQDDRIEKRSFRAGLKMTADLTEALEPGSLVTMTSDPTPLGDCSHWLILALKALAAMGFMTAADFVMLYAC